uniref:Uncharacterized protein n=1 Tax=Ombrophytum subterraneum TaxID=50155 RepID=A0A6M8PYM5_9MAGN|nr:hypothetical protein [Ombrophytum subterraneum]
MEVDDRSVKGQFLPEVKCLLGDSSHFERGKRGHQESGEGELFEGPQVNLKRRCRGSRRRAHRLMQISLLKESTCDCGLELECLAFTFSALLDQYLLELERGSL